MTRQFISYPKSGRTWIRFIFEQLDVGDAVDFHHDDFEFNDGSLPLHSYDLKHRLERYSPHDRVVYFDRDPRDVLVSLYYQVTGRFGDRFSFSGSISDFIRDAYFGAKPLHGFRTMWRRIVNDRGYKVARYEDCFANVAGTVAALLCYYDLPYDAEHLSEVAANATFDRMREVELAGSFPHPWLRPKNGALKMRRGKPQAHRDVLSRNDIAYLDDIFEMQSPPASRE